MVLYTSPHPEISIPKISTYSYTTTSIWHDFIKTEGVLSIAPPRDFHPPYPLPLLAFGATCVSDGIILVLSPIIGNLGIPSQILVYKLRKRQIKKLDYVLLKYWWQTTNFHICLHIFKESSIFITLFGMDFQFRPPKEGIWQNGKCSECSEYLGVKCWERKTGRREKMLKLCFEGKSLSKSMSYEHI